MPFFTALLLVTGVSCALLFLLSLPIQVSLSFSDKAYVYIRIPIVGMIWSSHGHTTHKTQNTSKKKKKRSPKAAASRIAAQRAIRVLLRRSTLHIDSLHLPRGAVRSPAALGLLLWVSGTALAAADTFTGRLRTAPLALTDTPSPEGSVTASAAALDLLWAVCVFLYTYIRRKIHAWQKHT